MSRTKSGAFGCEEDNDRAERTDHRPHRGRGPARAVGGVISPSGQPDAELDRTKSEKRSLHKSGDGCVMGSR